MENQDITIRVVEIAGFASVLQALRLPFGLSVRSNTQAEYSVTQSSETDSPCISVNSFCCIDKKDLQLLSRLIKTGDQHAKAARGLQVYLEITAPRYLWQEIDTYRIGTDRLASESTMHIQGKNLSTEELIAMKSELKEGTQQKRMQVFSYQTLRRIYFQRHNHRLPQWKEFCRVIETLPFAQELILVGLSERKNGDEH